MGQDETKVYMPGPCTVVVNGGDVGHTDEHGAEADPIEAYVDAKAGKYGPHGAPVQKFSAGTMVKVKFNLIQSVYTDIATVYSLFTATTSGGNTKLGIGRKAGAPLTGVTLVLTPEQSARTPFSKFTLTRAVPTGAPKLVWTAEKYQAWACEFEGMVDEAGGSEGFWLGTLGDPTISADVTAPTATCVPVDDATGVATTVVPVVTFSEIMNQNTLDALHVKLVEWSGAVGTNPTVRACTLTPTTTTLTITPAAPLTSGLKYSIQLNSVADLAGNLLNGGWATFDFTIA